MKRFFETHRHSEYSLFDGMGKIKASVARAKELGYTAFGISDHGTISGIIEHYNVCKENGINPICGVEGYFQPSFSQTKPRYHLCLYAKNLQGYKNLCKLLSLANRDNFYYVANITWDLLKEYHEGLICTSACVAGAVSQLIIRGHVDKAENTINKFKDIFGDDYYIEVMPYKIDDQGTQERVDRELIKLAKKTKTKIIITTDSHFVNKEDFDTHKKMFEMQGKDMGDTYKQRYMPSEEQMIRKCIHMGYKQAEINEWLDNLQEISSKCKLEIKFESTIPRLSWDKDSKEVLKELTIEGAKKKKKFTDDYKQQIKHELKVINTLGFEDYFLLVHDFIQEMKRKKIIVMPGRGSVCGSVVAYTLGITNVDPLFMGTNFDRFLRVDKVKTPDIDLDLSSDRRSEAIEYINQKYSGCNTQICTFGYYRTANLTNDLGKVYNLTPEEIEELKMHLEGVVGDRHRSEVLDLKELLKDRVIKRYEEVYPQIVTHFSKLWGQIRFFGTHASGVAITSNDIMEYMCLVRTKDGLRSCFDMENIDSLKILKLDILGLENASVISEIENMVGEKFRYKYLNDDAVYEEFRKGNTAGIFQFESYGGTKVITEIQPDNFFDIVAANALNRPAPKQLGMVEEYVKAKNGEIDTKTPYYQYAKDSHGCLIYQETVMRICKELANMEWNDVDRQIKLAGKETEEKRVLRDKFVSNLVDSGTMTTTEAMALHEKMSLYLFNKGHAVGYALIGFYEMYLKHYYPFEFYYSILKHAKLEINLLKYKVEAVKSGMIILPPNINGSASFSIVDIDGGKALQEGLSSIKGIGGKTAKVIQENAPYISFKDFEERVPKQAVNKKSKEVLKQHDCFIFDDEELIKKTVKYNAILKNKRIR